MPDGSNSGSASSSGTLSAMSVRRILICFAIVTTFTLCWLPLQLALYVMSVGNLWTPLNLMRWLTIFTSFNSCVNPIIYGLMWRPFRTALREVMNE